MPRLDRYILSLLLGLFGFHALVLVSVYWINRAVQLFEQLLRDGRTALVVLEFTALTLPIVIALVLPLAAYAAAASVTHRLATDSELVAMQAAGAAPARLARPVLVFGLVVAAMVAALVHGLVPMARARLAERQAVLAEDVTAALLRAGQFQHPADGVTLFIGAIGADGVLRDLLIEDARNPARVTVYTAREALLLRGSDGAEPALVMRDGMAQERRGAGGPLAVTRFETLRAPIGGLLARPAQTGRDLRDYGTGALLTAAPALLAATGASAGQSRAEAHQRMAQPLLAPVAALIGFAAGVAGGFSRLPGWRAVAVGVVALIAVQLALNAAADRIAGAPGLWPLAYAPALLAAAGIAAVLIWTGRPRARGAAA